MFNVLHSAKEQHIRLIKCYFALSNAREIIFIYTISATEWYFVNNQNTSF